MQFFYDGRLRLLHRTGTGANVVVPGLCRMERGLPQTNIVCWTSWAVSVPLPGLHMCSCLYAMGGAPGCHSSGRETGGCRAGKMSSEAAPHDLAAWPLHPSAGSHDPYSARGCRGVLPCPCSEQRPHPSHRLPSCPPSFVVCSVLATHYSITPPRHHSFIVRRMHDAVHIRGGT